MSSETGFRILKALQGGCVADVLQVELADGTLAVAKRARVEPVDFRLEARMLRTLEARARLPVPEVLASTRTASAAPVRLDAVAQRAATLGAGKAAMLDAPVGTGYAMVKRIGDAPLSALVLQIDAAQLIAGDALQRCARAIGVADQQSRHLAGHFQQLLRDADVDDEHALHELRLQPQRR